MRRVLSEILLWAQVLYENAALVLLYLLTLAAFLTSMALREYWVAAGVLVAGVCIALVYRHEISNGEER